MSERGGNISHVEAMLLEYINRRFPGSKAIAPLDEKFVNKPIPDEVSPFLRLVDPQFPAPADAIKNVPSRIDKLTLRALYCDQFPIERDYTDVLAMAAQEGNYESTHAALAFAWLRENRCLGEQDAMRLKGPVRDGLLRVINSRTAAIDDPYVEAVVMMYYAGFGESVDKTWLDRIVQAQLPNGAWATHEGEKTPSDHTTVLAYWALLEAQGAAKADEPWIRKSSHPQSF